MLFGCLVLCRLLFSVFFHFPGVHRKLRLLHSSLIHFVSRCSCSSLHCCLHWCFVQLFWYYDSYTASFVALSSSLDPSVSFYCYLFSLFQLSFCYKGYCEFFCVGYCPQASYLAIHSSHIYDCYGYLFIFPNSLSSLFLTFGVLFLMCCGAFLGFHAMVIVSFVGLCLFLYNLLGYVALSSLLEQVALGWVCFAHCWVVV